MIAASILQTRGYRNFTEVEGGFNGIKKTEKVPTTDFVCQSKNCIVMNIFEKQTSQEINLL